MTTTFKTKVDESDRVLLDKIQSYKRLLKRQNSNDTTNPSSEDN